MQEQQCRQLFALRWFHACHQQHIEPSFTCAASLHCQVVATTRPSLPSSMHPAAAAYWQYVLGDWRLLLLRRAHWARPAGMAKTDSTSQCSMLQGQQLP
jgi:hypothetical protein